MPGSGKQPPEVQQEIRNLLEAGYDPTTIHRRLKVGRSSIYRMKRCLQRHGTTYIPPEMTKKNGRPKVLTSEQELQLRDYLRDPSNREKFLDDLVWLIHDRFGIVCSTTTMSKLKRKWLRVFEYEETGRRLDEWTVRALRETHPGLPILKDPAAVGEFGEVGESDAQDLRSGERGEGRNFPYFDPSEERREEAVPLVDPVEAVTDPALLAKSGDVEVLLREQFAAVQK